MPATLSRRFGLDHLAGGARVHEHVTPRVVRLVVAAAHRPVAVLAPPRQRFRFRARQVARHAPRTSGLRLDQTLLAALAAHRGARGRLCKTTRNSVPILYRRSQRSENKYRTNISGLTPQSDFNHFSLQRSSGYDTQEHQTR